MSKPSFLRATDVCLCSLSGMAPIPSASDPRRCWRCGGLIPAVPSPDSDDAQRHKPSRWEIPFGMGFTVGVAVAIFCAKLGLAGLALGLPFLLCASLILYIQKKEVDENE